MRKLVALLSLLFCAGGLSFAGVIFSPVAVIGTIPPSYDAFSVIGNTINHSGLLTDFTSGVTDFDTYIAGNPLHSYVYADNEWFAPAGVYSATIDYDLGGAHVIDGMAYWNEESWGADSVSVYASSTSDFASAVFLGTFSPTNWLLIDDYGADVFAFSATSAQYLRLVVTGNSDLGQSVSMGEMALREGVQGQVPEPGTVALLGLGLAALALFRKRS